MPTTLRKIQLLVRKEGEGEREFPLELAVGGSGAVIGRSSDCAVQLDDRAVSRRHAELRLIEGGAAGARVQVVRKSEFGPIQLNGEEKDEATLAAGDVLGVGPFRIRLVESAEFPSETVHAAPSPESSAASPAPVPVDAPTAPMAMPAADFSMDPVEQGADGAVVAQGASGMEISGEPAPLEGGLELEMGASAAVPTAVGSDATQVGGISIAAESDPGGQTRVGAIAQVEFLLKLAPGVADVEEFRIEKDEIRIGRGKSCDLVLKDKKASRVHAILKRAGMRIVLQDQGSSHGTFINDQKVTEQEIYSDDVIQIGESRMTLVARDPNFESAAAGFAAVPAALQSYGASLVESPQPSYLSGDQGGAEVGMPPVQGVPLDGIAGHEAIAGIPGIGSPPAAPAGKKTLLQRYRELPPEKQRMVAIGAMLLAVMMVLAPQDDGKSKRAKGKQPQATQSSQPSGPRTYAQLSPEDKAAVDAAYKSAMNYFVTKEFSSALLEVQKIFRLVPDHVEGRELERYSLEGQRRMEALRKEEERRKEEEARVSRIRDLVAEIRVLMEAKNYPEAESRFSAVLELDAENVDVKRWQGEIKQAEAERVEAEQRRLALESMRQEAQRQFEVADGLRKAGKYKQAIGEYRLVANYDDGVDAKLRAIARKSRAMIDECIQGIAARRDPLLAEAREAEDAGDFATAYSKYELAKKADPDHPGGQEGMDRVRGALNARAKTAYTEAVLAESFSEFKTARAKFEEVLRIAPRDDKAPESYYQRAQRKLASYVQLNVGESPGADAGGAPPTGGP